jgi:hypothetical protein
MSLKGIYAVVTVLLMAVGVYRGIKDDEWLEGIGIMVFVYAVYSVLTSAV